MRALSSFVHLQGYDSYRKQEALSLQQKGGQSVSKHSLAYCFDCYRVKALCIILSAWRRLHDYYCTHRGCSLASIKRHRFCSRHKKPPRAKLSPKATKIIKTVLFEKPLSYLQTLISKAAFLKEKRKVYFYFSAESIHHKSPEGKLILADLLVFFHMGEGFILKMW